MADPESFVALYEREAEPVLVFLARRTLDAEVALDLTAETFAQAWQGWPRVRPESTEEVRAWLFTIARRQLGRYLRRGTVERRALAAVGLSVPRLCAEDVPEIERATGLDELRRSVNAGLRTLPGNQRDAIRLRVVDELSYAEVARRLGVSEPAARRRPLLLHGALTNQPRRRTRPLTPNAPGTG